MDIGLQYKIYNDELLHKYLRENSHWYKILNRDPELIDQMINDMKRDYKLNFSDKIEKLEGRLSLINSLISTLS